MTETRRWYNVGAVKLPEAERDVAASVFRNHPERFSDIIGADTPEDHERYPVGTHTAYAALLTEAEAERFSRASNARYVEPDRVHTNVRALLTLGQSIPTPRTQRYLQAEIEAYPTLTGAGAVIGMVDEGTTGLARAVKQATLRAKTWFTYNGEPLGEIFSLDAVHGCLVQGDFPCQAEIVDAVAIDGNNQTTDASMANAITWCGLMGANFINMSLTLGGESSIVDDALINLYDRDIAVFVAAGNEGLRINRYPASTAGWLPYVHSIGSIDMSTGQRSSFSNWGPWVTGLSPGELVYTTNWNGDIVQWGGTSASTPNVLQLAARITSTGVSAKQAAAALKATTRDLGLGEQQGGGLYSMTAALRWLNREPPIQIVRPDSVQKPGLPLW